MYNLRGFPCDPSNLLVMNQANSKDTCKLAGWYTPHCYSWETEASCRKHVTNYLVQMIPSKPLSTEEKKWAEFHWKFTPKSDSWDKLVTRITRAAETLREPLLCTCFSSMVPSVSLLSHAWVACSCVYVGDGEQPGQGPIVFRISASYLSDGGLWRWHMQKFLQGNPGRTSHSHNFASAAEKAHMICTWRIEEAINIQLRPKSSCTHYIVTSHRHS